MNFLRKDGSAINAALNYGYSLILRLSTKKLFQGYLTQLGLHHHGSFNPFNFSSDLMEPYRPLIDRWVLERDYKV